MGMLVSCLSNIMYLSEKFTLWLTCVGLICCLMVTFVVTLGMGIGLGYNYCFVDLKTRYRHIPGHYVYPGNSRWPYKTPKPNLRQSEEELGDPRDEELRTLPSIVPMDPISITDKFEPFWSEVNNKTEINDDEQPVRRNFYKKTLFRKLGFPKNPSDITVLDDSQALNDTDISSLPINKIEDADDANPANDVDSEVNVDPIVDIIINSNPKDKLGTIRIKQLDVPITSLGLRSLLTQLNDESGNYTVHIVLI